MLPFVVVDSLSTANKYSVYQESQMEYARPILQMTGLAAQHKTTFLIIHHTNREGGVRGTTAIRNAVSEVWLLTKDNSQTATPYDRILEINKSRSRSSGKKYRLMFNPEDLQFTFLGEESEQGFSGVEQSANDLGGDRGGDRGVIVGDRLDDNSSPSPLKQADFKEGGIYWSPRFNNQVMIVKLFKTLPEAEVYQAKNATDKFRVQLSELYPLPIEFKVDDQVAVISEHKKFLDRVFTVSAVHPGGIWIEGKTKTGNESYGPFQASQLRKLSG